MYDTLCGGSPSFSLVDFAKKRFAIEQVDQSNEQEGLVDSPANIL